MFIIRQKSTGYCLPHRCKPRGYTHDEPKSLDKSMPRFFIKRHHAQSALDWWLDGITEVKPCSHFSSYYGYTDDGEDWITTKVPHRTKEDMEIVEVKGAKVVLEF